MDYCELGQKIRKCRRRQGLSQEDLAKKVGISAAHISRIENGNTKVSIPVFARLVWVLGVSSDELLGIVSGE